eukprot:12027588-Alexandrium_andersonii.AAC.1
MFNATCTSRIPGPPGCWAAVFWKGVQREGALAVFAVAAVAARGVLEEVLRVGSVAVAEVAGRGALEEVPRVGSVAVGLDT